MTTSRGPRRLPARLPRHLRAARHGRGRPRDPGAGRSRPSADPRRAVHQGLALRRAHLPPGARAASAAGASGPRAAGSFERIGWDEALADIARAPVGDRRARPAGHRARTATPARWAWCRARAWRRASSTGSAPRCSTARSARSAGGEALAATYGAKVGMHVEHFAESRLILIWGSNSITSNLHFWTFAQAGQARRRQAGRASTRAAPRPPRSATSTSRCCPAPTARWRSALMHELIVNDWLDHDYIARHVEGWPSAARARAAVAARARGRGRAAHAPTKCASLARDYGTHRSRRRSASTTACSACAAAAMRCA